VLAGRENELNSIKASLFFGSILRFKILEGILQGWKRGDGPRKSRDVKLVNPSENREERSGGGKTCEEKVMLELTHLDRVAERQPRVRP
jgi:hypothetical protein